MTSKDANADTAYKADLEALRIRKREIGWSPNVARKQNLDAMRRRQIEKAVARVSAVNRPDVEAHVVEYMNRCKLTSVEQFVIAVLRADEHRHR